MKVTILGAGIAGLTTAIALKKIGIEYEIFEATPEIKPVGAGLGLGANAIQCFRHLGIADEVINAGNVLSSFTIYDQKGKKISKTDSTKISRKYGIDNFTIHRGALHEILLKHAGKENITTSKRSTGFERKVDKVSVQFKDGSSTETSYLIVADGIHSSIRQQLLPGSTLRYAGYTCWRAVIDDYNTDRIETSETWGTKGRFGIVPLVNNKLYWFACINAPENDLSMKTYQVKHLADNFKNYHEPVPSILKNTSDSQLIWNDIYDIAPIHQYAFDNILLTGDAAHATTPNMGQGACMAIEDAVVLGKVIQTEKNISLAFKKFEKERLARTHWITNTSRRIGEIAQASGTFKTGLRDTILRLIPNSFQEKQLDFLYNFSI